MSGKGELVTYTRLHKKKPISPADKAELKAKINKVIDEATTQITIIALVEAALADLTPDKTLDEIIKIYPGVNP